ncbi:MAG TPA: aminodeoxychorismate synthase component I [Candidatus Latescibacteria bacterium]|nr:aminodeoxychorismate synthase component I [Candidatus Latescibacterota bacterium]
MTDARARTMRAPMVILRDARHGQWLKFVDPQRTLVASKLQDVLPVLETIDTAAEEDALYCAGFVSYEATPAFDAGLAAHAPGRFPLAWFCLFRSVEPVDIPAPPAKALSRTLRWYPSVSRTEYCEAIRRVHAFIESGDTYQVNYTYRLQSEVTFDRWEFFLRLVVAQNPPYGGYIDTGEWTICSASPELFFTRRNGELESRPMKGTAARGKTLAEDLLMSERLQTSLKERAENVMIVDMVRNDFGRVALTGSVAVRRLFEIERYPTIWQMTSTVTAKTEERLQNVFRATFPPASITGAPKIRTTQIIADLETTLRNIYTGTIGFVTPGGDAQFNVAIRTALIDRTGKAEYGAGSGIVWDSDAESEWEECETKAKVLSAEVPEFQLLETMRWEPRSGYYLKTLHLRRLVESADYFGFRVDMREVRRKLRSFARTLPQKAHRIRLLVHRSGTMSLEAFPLASRIGNDVRVAVAREPVSTSDVFVYHKTTNRRVYESAMRENPGCRDVILWNERGEVTESTVANVFVNIGGRLFTPPVACGLLGGTMRAHLINTGRVTERVVSISELLTSPAVYLANSVRGMYRVRVLSPTVRDLEASGARARRRG